MTNKFDSLYDSIVESTSKAPKGDSYDSENNWKPSGVASYSDGPGGRYRRTRPNKPGRSKATHGGRGVQDEEDHTPFDNETNSDYNTQESEESNDDAIDITMTKELADVLHELLMNVVDAEDGEDGFPAADHDAPKGGIGSRSMDRKELKDKIAKAKAKGHIDSGDAAQIMRQHDSDEDGKHPDEDAEYRGRKVTLNKPTRGDVKKFKVYVKDPKTGNVKKVNFGHGGTSAKRKGEKTMKIRKSNPKARKSFRARHNCDNPGPKTKARYWSCRKW